MSSAAFAVENFRQVTGSLNVLSLDYGVNELRVNGQNFIITKGEFNNGNAWGGDVYSVFKNRGRAREIAHFENGKTSVMSAPHTGEDVIRSVYFLASRDNARLYMLKSERFYKHQPYEEVPAVFTLYRLENDEQGILEFEEIGSETSKNKYTNADTAVCRELSKC